MIIGLILNIYFLVCILYIPTINKYKIASDLLYNSDNSNITYIKTQHRQIIAIIIYRILKCETIIKKPLMTKLHIP